VQATKLIVGADKGTGPSYTESWFLFSLTQTDISIIVQIISFASQDFS